MKKQLFLIIALLCAVVEKNEPAGSRIWEDDEEDDDYWEF
jgi:hypothetical protein